MRVRTKPITAVAAVALLFSGPVIGANYAGSSLPSQGGHLERSDFAASGTKESSSSPRGEQLSAGSELPRQGGHIDGFGTTVERSDFAAFETKEMPLGSPSSRQQSAGSSLPMQWGYIR